MYAKENARIVDNMNRAVYSLLKGGKRVASKITSKKHLQTGNGF